MVFKIGLFGSLFVWFVVKFNEFWLNLEDYGFNIYGVGFEWFID